MPSERPPKPPPPRRPERPTYEELVELGMPPALATQVVKGLKSEEDAWEVVRISLLVNDLMQKYQLSRPFATQVARGQADLEVFLARRQLASHLEANRERSCLHDALAHQRRMTFLVHGKRRIEGRVVEVERFDVVIELDGGVREKLRKVEIKAAWIADDRQLNKRMMDRKDNERSKNPKAPIPRPQDRYPLADRTLFSFLVKEADANAPDPRAPGAKAPGAKAQDAKGTDSKVHVDVTLLEGEIVSGQILWFGRYEIGMGLKGRHLVTVFRHAIDDFRAAKD